jgi:hypothetical protein
MVHKSMNGPAFNMNGYANEAIVPYLPSFFFLRLRSKLKLVLLLIVFTITVL